MRFLNVIGACAVAALLFVEGCAPKATTTATQAPGKYSEDLSVYRPKVDEPVDSLNSITNNGTATTKTPTQYVEARHAINEPLEDVLDSIDRYNLSNGLVDGFTIQFYSGTKREEALAVKKELSVVLPKIDAEVQYVQPNFRVRGGRYISRVEAQKDYMTIKKHFPSAIVIPDRLSINEVRSRH